MKCFNYMKNSRENYCSKKSTKDCKLKYLELSMSYINFCWSCKQKNQRFILNTNFYKIKRKIFLKISTSMFFHFRQECPFRWVKKWQKGTHSINRWIVLDQMLQKIWCMIITNFEIHWHWCMPVLNSNSQSSNTFAASKRVNWKGNRLPPTCNRFSTSFWKLTFQNTSFWLCFPNQLFWLTTRCLSSTNYLALLRNFYTSSWFLTIGWWETMNPKAANTS